MNISKLLIGAVVGGIVLFFLGWLIYGNLLMSFMRHHTGEIGHHADRREMLYLYLVVGNLLQGALLSYILVKSNVSSLIGGVVTGAVVGLLMAASVDAIMYATTLMLSKQSMVADIAATTIMSAIAGGAIALVTGAGKSRGSKG